MRKYVAGIAIAVAATAMGTPALAGAHARTITQAHRGKMDLVFLGKRDARRELYVQRVEPSTSTAQAASCPAGQLIQSYCSPPAEDNLFGAFSYNDGSTTFGSTNTNNCRALGYSAEPCGVYTTVTNELIVAFASADAASSGNQSVTVSCTTYTGGTCPVTFHKVAAENAGGGDSEVWYADATSIISRTAPIFVKASVGKACGGRWSACDVGLQAVTFKNAITPGGSGVQGTGIGASSTCYSLRAAPTCALTTTEPDSMVWAAYSDPNTGSSPPTWPSGQFAIGVADAVDQPGTFGLQFAGSCSGSCNPMALPQDGLYQNPFTISPTAFPTLGTKVTINDTSPTNEPFNLVDVEIL
jgi:hypothetical protein